MDTNQAKLIAMLSDIAVKVSEARDFAYEFVETGDGVCDLARSITEKIGFHLRDIVDSVNKYGGDY
jgi:hypothetical protein